LCAHAAVWRVRVLQIAADQQAGLTELQAAGMPLADHVALYLASQQLAMGIDLYDLGAGQVRMSAYIPHGERVSIQHHRLAPRLLRGQAMLLLSQIRCI
jgi:hypothetical protein